MPDETDDSNENLYLSLKEITIKNDLSSQVVSKNTIMTSQNGLPKYNNALHNITLGVLAKTGNIPFVLDTNVLDFADLIVGIDVARRSKATLAGSINATAIARIYLNSGDFLKYSIHDANLEGETIPKKILQALFPAKDFYGKRVVIHRDGYFRGNEKQDLIEWGDQINAAFLLVEVIKSGCPRIYCFSLPLKYPSL